MNMKDKRLFLSDAMIYQTTNWGNVSGLKLFTKYKKKRKKTKKERRIAKYMGQ